MSGVVHTADANSRGEVLNHRWELYFTSEAEAQQVLLDHAAMEVLRRADMTAAEFDRIMSALQNALTTPLDEGPSDPADAILTAKEKATP